MTAHCFCQYDIINDISYNCSVPGPTLIMYSGTTVNTNWFNKLVGETAIIDIVIWI